MSLRARILSAICRRPVKLLPSDWTYVKFYFGQFGEDAVFLSMWDWQHRRHGFYVDVGAYHPIDLSNTHMLYRHGWRGVTIDPNPKLAPLFARHRPRGTHLVCAVGEREGQADYFAFTQANYNTIDPAVAEQLSTERAFEKMTVPVRPLAAILREHGPANGEIDLLSVDCEGYDEVVLRANDWSRFRPAWIMVEDENAGDESGTARLLKEQGYQLAAWLKMTKIYQRRETA
jgi:FkbM family methyltransferase